MKIEEAIDILENIIADEVIGTYCVEIQKEGVNCSKNCEDKDCYLSEAISTIVNYIDKLQKENKELKEKINKVVLMIDDNYRSEWYDDYETIAGLRDDIYDLLMIKYKGVKE